MRENYRLRPRDFIHIVGWGRFEERNTDSSSDSEKLKDIL